MIGPRIHRYPPPPSTPVDGVLARQCLGPHLGGMEPVMVILA
jgi:hypothetical protein